MDHIFYFSNYHFLKTKDLTVPKCALAWNNGWKISKTWPKIKRFVVLWRGVLIFFISSAHALSALLSVTNPCRCHGQALTLSTPALCHFHSFVQLCEKENAAGHFFLTGTCFNLQHGFPLAVKPEVGLRWSFWQRKSLWWDVWVHNKATGGCVEECFASVVCQSNTSIWSRSIHYRLLTLFNNCLILYGLW